MNKLLSIILVSKDNDENLLSLIRALDELEYLNFKKNIQIIVIDSSISFESVQKQCDQCGIIFKWQSPLGIYSAMNFGIDVSSSEWLWFLNPGDSPILNASLLLKILEQEQHNLSPALVFKTKTMAEDGSFLRYRNTQIRQKRFLSNAQTNYCHQGIIYRRSNFDSGLRYDIKYKLISDKIMNDFILGANCRLFDFLLASFVTGGLSSNKRNIRKELLHYSTLCLVGWYKPFYQI